MCRAYQRSITQRLLRSVLLEWQDAASQSLCSAVQHFAQQLGLQQQQAEDREGEGAARTAGIELGRSMGKLTFTLVLNNLEKE